MLIALYLMILCLILVALGYMLAIFMASRHRRPKPLPSTPGLFFIFVLPCLNEELVIQPSVDRLLAIPASNFAVLVVDDDSDDATAEIVRRYDPGRVWLLRRTRPNARRGKGAALNAAYRYIRDYGVLREDQAKDIVLVVVDADGRMASNALFEVAPYFADPLVGAVQIAVRMYNARENLLARMQDMEFVAYTEIFQRGRQRLGSVALGGNGQFTRLTALDSLGGDPWTDCLTEDLELGLRLRLAGWRNAFCPTAWVAQQAVTETWRLIRQRSRWFQGNLQCWKMLIPIIRSNMPLRTTLDLVIVLNGSVLILLTSFMLLSFATSATALALRIGPDPSPLLTVWLAIDAVAWYVLAFAPAIFYGFVYWLREPKLSLPRSIALGHIYSLYAYLWFLAGWLAVWRALRRRRGWLKTSRTATVAS
jgi:cellulose synthase/poly-beta-1,6-N-acetylglucosamine synthase-like glycosyltransferase